MHCFLPALEYAVLDVYLLLLNNGALFSVPPPCLYCSLARFAQHSSSGIQVWSPTYYILGLWMPGADLQGKSAKLLSFQ